MAGPGRTLCVHVMLHFVLRDSKIFGVLMPAFGFILAPAGEEN